MNEKANPIDLAELPEIMELAKKENTSIDEVVRRALKNYMNEQNESKVDKWIRIIEELVQSSNIELEV